MQGSYSARYNPTKFLLAAAILLFFIIAYWTPYQKMAIRWDNGDNNYCYLVVPLFLYLLWDKRDRGSRFRVQGSGFSSGKFKGEDEKFDSLNSFHSSNWSKEKEKNDNEEGDSHKGFRFGEFSWNPIGFVPLIIAIFLIFIGELGSIETLMYIGLWGCVVGIVFLLYGWRIRQLAFPLLILAFIVPLPPYINRILTFQLKLAASTIATIMLRLSGVSVFQDGNIIDLGVTQLQVVEACSGLRYLMPLFLLALLIGYFFTKGWWRNITLLLLVVPLSVFFNALRIWLSGILTVKGHPELVESFFHDFSGWVIFIIAGAILFAVTRVLNRVGKGKEEEVQSELKFKVPKVESELKLKGYADESELKFNVPKVKKEKQPEKQVGFARPLAITVAACLLFVTSGYALKKIPSATNLPDRQSFKSFPNNIGQWEGRRSYIPKDILEQLWADDYVEASFVNAHTRNAIHLLIPFYEWQGTRHTIHAPQSCLLGGGWALTGSKERMVNVGEDREIPVMTLMLEKGNAKILGSYFFFQRGRVLTNPWLNKAYLMWDAFTKRRTDGALVRAELVMAPGQTIDDAWGTLKGFISELWPILPKYVPE